MSAEREIVRRLQESRRARVLSEAQETKIENIGSQQSQERVDESTERVDESVESEEDKVLTEGEGVCPDCGESSEDCECDLEECDDSKKVEEGASKKELKEGYVLRRPSRAALLMEGTYTPYVSSEWESGVYKMSANTDDYKSLAEKNGFTWDEEWGAYVKKSGEYHLQLLAGEFASDAELPRDGVFLLIFTGDPSENGEPVKDADAQSVLSAFKC